MKIAVIGSRNLDIDDIEKYLPSNIDELITGGARGIDTLAKEYALSIGVKVTEFLPDYKRYGRAAPLKRNLEIISAADNVVAIWDGQSRGTRHVIDECRKIGKPITVFTVQ